MIHKNGYYLIEVLMALMIFSYSSLSLFKYQWQLLKKSHLLYSEWTATRLMDNLSERIVAGKKSLDPALKHRLLQNLPDADIQIDGSQLSISWLDATQAKSGRQQVIRQL